jgi:hypothetical protein
LAYGNEAIYIRAMRTGLAGIASMATGFSAEIIDPRPILAALRNAGVVGSYDLGDYGKPNVDAKEVCRYNTALLLRRVLEVSQSEGDEFCRDEIMSFRARYKLDEGMIAQAREGSALLRQYF